MRKTLGVIGGLGPMATAYFLELVTKMTKAASDQEHLHVLIDSEPRTPDRTGFLTGEKTEDPYPWLLKGGRMDHDRCCSVVLDEFRGGKLGRITLEKPAEFETEEDKIND